MAKKQNTLSQLLRTKLNVLLYVEKELTKALPDMAENATNPDLKMAFESHLKETEQQVERLEQCFEELGETAEPLESDALNGLVKDATWVIGKVEMGPALDASLAAAARAVEHYEMALYSTAVEWANLLGHDSIEALLEENLEEEMAADEKLSTLAIEKIHDQVDTGSQEE